MVGIVGGLGSETTVKLYMNIVKLFIERHKSYPNIVIDNVAFPVALEEDIIINSKNEREILPYLLDSIKRLGKVCDFIVIPCNTVHIFIDELQRQSNVPIINMIEEVVKSLNTGKIGIMASTKTIESGLYQSQLSQLGFEYEIPSKTDQLALSGIIVRIIRNQTDNKDIESIKLIIKNLEKMGVDSILFACTDLGLIINKKDLNIKIIDTIEILTARIINLLTNGDIYG